MFENPINKLRFWCHKVIPLVYDEALSYYEVLCKVAKKINELIADVNGLHETVVFKVNNKEPTDGNVQLGADDFSGVFAGSVNGITPDSEGNIALDGSDIPGGVTGVNGKTPVDGEVTLNAFDVGAIPNTVRPVESVNGSAPDASGNVNVGTVKTVNNITPDVGGNVNVGTVKTVNGSAPDGAGNVNLPTVAGVTSVDGIGPDSSGNVQLGNTYVKTVNSELPVNGNVTIDAADVGAIPNTEKFVKSVNDIIPDATGEVTLSASDIGAIPDTERFIKTFDGKTPNSAGELTASLASNYNRYVDGANGDDSNDGSQAHPWKTITKAINDAKKYFIPSLYYYNINITGGEYPELLNLNYLQSGVQLVLGGDTIIGGISGLTFTHVNITGNKTLTLKYYSNLSYPGNRHLNISGDGFISSTGSTIIKLIAGTTGMTGIFVGSNSKLTVNNKIIFDETSYTYTTKLNVTQGDAKINIIECSGTNIGSILNNSIVTIGKINNGIRYDGTSVTSSILKVGTALDGSMNNLRTRVNSGLTTVTGIQDTWNYYETIGQMCILQAQFWNSSGNAITGTTQIASGAPVPINSSLLFSARFSDGSVGIFEIDSSGNINVWGETVWPTNTWVLLSEIYITNP